MAAARWSRLLKTARVISPHGIVLLLAPLGALALGAGRARSVRASSAPSGEGAAPGSVAKADVAAVADASNALAWDLERSLDPAGNTVFSPSSIWSSVALAEAGAAGETARQMEQVLHLGRRTRELDAAAGVLSGRLRADGATAGNALSVASGLFIQRGLPVRPSFRDLLARDFAAPPSLLDFAGDPAGAVEAIDRWVSAATRGRIDELLGPGDEEADCRVVLVAALYFKGGWATRFDGSRTGLGPFRVSARETVQAPLMEETARLGYLRGPGFAMLELPYSGGLLALDVLLPDDPDGLPALRASLSARAFRSWVAGLRAREVAVTLPRFSIRSRFDLGPALGALGMSLAYGPGADFSGIDGKRDLFIRKSVHAARIDVDEEGTVAAAATAHRTTRRIVRLPQRFVADHPFLFVLRDRAADTILFLGRVVDPTAK